MRLIFVDERGRIYYSVSNCSKRIEKKMHCGLLYWVHVEMQFLLLLGTILLDLKAIKTRNLYFSDVFRDT